MKIYMVVECKTEDLPQSECDKSFAEIRSYLLEKAKIENDNYHKLIDVYDSLKRVEDQKPSTNTTSDEIAFLEGLLCWCDKFASQIAGVNFSKEIYGLIAKLRAY